jgi:hypothetical protein
MVLLLPFGRRYIVPRASYPRITPGAGLGRVPVGEHRVGFRSCGPNSHTSDFMSQPIVGEPGSSRVLEAQGGLLVIQVQLGFIASGYLHIYLFSHYLFKTERGRNDHEKVHLAIIQETDFIPTPGPATPPWNIDMASHSMLQYR